MARTYIKLCMVLCCMFSTFLIFQGCTPEGKDATEPVKAEQAKAETPVAEAEKPIVPETIPGIETIDAKQAKEAMAKGAHAYDVRPERAVIKGTIPDTEHLLYDSKSRKATDYDASKDSFDLSSLPEDMQAEIVFYCNGDTCWRSYKAALAAQKAGYKNIKWFRGGVPEWQGAGESVKVGASDSKEAK